MASLLPYARYPLYAVTSLFTLCSGALYWKQNELIYPRYLPPGCREVSGVPTPDQFGISHHSSPTLITPDGERLHTYLIHPPPTSYQSAGGGGGLVVIMFHGNAGNIGHRLPIAKLLAESAGVKVLMVEYRGYGLSTGEPDEEGMVRDAQTAVDWVRQSEECRGDGIVVYGQSIGGAVGVQVVAANQGPVKRGMVEKERDAKGDDEGGQEEGGEIRGLVLENTLTSMRKLIPSAFPPAKYLAPLCHQTWKSEEYLPKITNIPILFLSGLKDEIIPSHHMRTLRSLSRSPDVTYREFPNGNHNETVAQPGYFQHLVEFLLRV